MFRMYWSCLFWLHKVTHIHTDSIHNLGIWLQRCFWGMGQLARLWVEPTPGSLCCTVERMNSWILTLPAKLVYLEGCSQHAVVKCMCLLLNGHTFLAYHSLTACCVVLHYHLVYFCKLPSTSLSDQFFEVPDWVSTILAELHYVYKWLCTFACLLANWNNKGPIRIYNTGGQGFMAVSKQTLLAGYALGFGLFTAINPWHYKYNCNISILLSLWWDWLDPSVLP